MAAHLQSAAPPVGFRRVFQLGVCLFLTPAAYLSAQEPQGNLSVLVPQSRHLQHSGDLRLAETLALYDVEHHEDQAQLAGGLEVLASIYRQSGRYQQSLELAQRYEQVLAGVPNADASARQDGQLLLAEILANLDQYPEAIAHVDAALKVPKGWRSTEVLWEPHALALRARIEHAAGQEDASRADWREVESRVRGILNRIVQPGTNVDLEEDALELLTQSLTATDRTAEAVTLRQGLLGKQLDAEVRAKNWSEIAACYARLGQDDKEAHALREALALEAQHDGLRAQAAQADLLDRLGLVLKHQGDSTEAANRWKEAATVYRHLVDHYGARRRQRDRHAANLQKLELIYERLNDWPAAIETGERLLDVRGDLCLADDPRIWHIKSTLADLYLRTGDTGKARSLLTETVDYWRHRAVPAPLEVSRTLVAMSKASRLKQEPTHALAQAQEAVELCHKASDGHELQLAEAYQNLGTAQAAAKQPRQALESYRQAALICRDRVQNRQASLILCETLVEVARLYKAQHRYDLATKYCAQALEVRRTAPEKDPRAILALHTALASVQLAEQRVKAVDGSDGDLLAQAEANIAAARKLAQQHGWLEGAPGIEVLQLGALVDLRRQQPDAAKKMLDEALELARKAKAVKLEAKISGQIAQLDEQTGTPAKNSAAAKP